MKIKGEDKKQNEQKEEVIINEYKVFNEEGCRAENKSDEQISNRQVGIKNEECGQDCTEHKENTVNSAHGTKSSTHFTLRPLRPRYTHAHLTSLINQLLATTNTKKILSILKTLNKIIRSAKNVDRGECITRLKAFLKGISLSEEKIAYCRRKMREARRGIVAGAVVYEDDGEKQ